MSSTRKRGKKRTCVNCHGWGYIRLGLPLIGQRWPCPDCHSRGYIRDDDQ